MNTEKTVNTIVEGTKVSLTFIEVDKAETVGSDGSTKLIFDQIVGQIKNGLKKGKVKVYGKARYHFPGVIQTCLMYEGEVEWEAAT